MHEETLDHVLRVGRRVATTSNEGVERRPIGFAENGKRFFRGSIGAGLSCLQYDRPVRRVKRRAAFLQSSGNRFRRLALYANTGVIRSKTGRARAVVSTMLTRRIEQRR